MTRTVVTGGCGFLGSHVVSRLVERGDEVTVFDAGPPPRGWSVHGAHHVRGDIRDRDHIDSVLAPGVDVVFHLAAVVGVDRYLDRPLDVMDINLIGTRNVLERADEIGARVMVASTSEVFGKNAAVPWGEEADRVLGSTTVDRWSYSSSKALTEHMTFAFMRSRGLEATIIRYFNLYGPRQRPAFVVSRSVHRALRGLAPIIYDDGTQTRSLTFVEDAVTATLLATTVPQAIGECFNIGSSDEVSIRQVIEHITDFTGVDAFLSVDTENEFGSSYQDLPRRIPDTRKAEKLLGWHSSTTLKSGLRQTIEWARENPWWLETTESG